MTAGADPLLHVQGLAKHFALSRGFLGIRDAGTVRAVDGVDLSLGPGETLGLVGESGCGKSTTGKLILRLVEPTAGRIRFDGDDVLAADRAALRGLRRRMQIVFQDPYAALNPRMTVAEIIAEPLLLQGHGRGPALTARLRELMAIVGLPAAHLARYPHQFSGGQRQRIGIARAIAPRPKLIVCDEAVSALDVSVQAQVVNLLQDLQRDFGIAYLFIAHDLAVVKHIAHRVAVMYLGKVVEVADKHGLYAAPRHPYTQALLASVPVPHPRLRGRRARLAGEIPSPFAIPPGCRFHPRCPHAEAVCRETEPPLRTLAPGRSVACHLAEKIAGAPA
jgi:oligopeptide/dipeptide ABC transporter ATP-binding protein